MDFEISVMGVGGGKRDYYYSFQTKKFNSTNKYHNNVYYIPLFIPHDIA